MSKRRMSIDKEEASNSRERKKATTRRNPNQQQQEEAPIPANPNPEAPIPAQDLLFEKTLSISDATSSQLTITGEHRATLMAFLTDAERKKVKEIGVGLIVPTRVADDRYELKLKRNSTTYFNGWARVASASKVKARNSVQGFGYREAGEFRLNLNIIRNPNQQRQEEAPIPANPNPEAPIPANPNPEAPIPAQDLLFEKTLSFSDATSSQLTITGEHRATLMAFLTDAERKKVKEIGVGLIVPTRVADDRYELKLKRNSTTYFNGWARVASANKVKARNSVQGFGYRDAGEFRLNLNIIRNPNQQQEEAPIPAPDLLFEKKLTATETTKGRLLITGAHRATVLGFLTDEERKEAELKDGVGVKVPTRDGNGARYELELKRNKKLNNVYLMGWQEVARRNHVSREDLVQGFGYRAAGKFQLNLNIIKN